ncbi:MAG: hypothetical protein ACK5NT_05410 [Pyrinomonadaceae bacterium]
MEISQLTGFGAITLGALIALIGWIWLVIAGFKYGGILWGALNIFFQPITGLLFCIFHKRGWAPFSMLLVGLLLQAGGLIPLWNNGLVSFW